MDNPGIRTLGDVALAAINAATAGAVVTLAADEQGVTQPYVDRLQGAVAVLISASFTYGAGGDTLKVVVETTPDQGTTWVEVARFAFAMASAQKVANLSALTPVAVYTPAALSDDTVKDGIIGDRFRARIIKGAGAAYSGNTGLTLRIHVR
jgi:hypothetical protein